MEKETLDQLIDECIKALQETSRVLSENLQKIKEESRDLREKQKFLEEWKSDHLEENRHLLIDFDKLVPSLPDPPPSSTDPDSKKSVLREAVRELSNLKGEFVQYRKLIEDEFEKLASQKRDEIERLQN